MLLTWTQDAWNDYLHWQTQDKKTLKRINKLINDILREPFTGIGQPEPLRADLQGSWSRRIDHANRLVYQVLDGEVVILAVEGHYDDH